MTRLPDTDRARLPLGKRGAFEGVARWPWTASGMGTDDARTTTTNQPRYNAQRVVGKVGRSITNSETPHLAPKNVFIAGRQEPSSKRTARRLRRYRTGAEGRISHLKRRYGLDRSRLKGDQGRQIWTEWAILAYNADTLAVREH